MLSNPEQESLLNRSIDALRRDTPEATKEQATVVKMLATDAKHPLHIPAFRYVAVAGAAAALAGIALWPQPSAAASLRMVLDAVKQQQTRYERVTRRDASGAMKLVVEEWYAPGKHATIWPNGHEGRDSGTLSYSYWPDQGYQVIRPGEAMEADAVDVESFLQIPTSKLLQVKESESTSTYVFGFGGGTSQELVIDRATKLPLRRIAHWDHDQGYEVHEYSFNQKLSANFFEPHVKEGVPLYNVSEDRQKLAAALEAKPLTQTVAGIKVSLHAVMIDPSGYVDVITTGGAPRAMKSITPKIDGLPRSPMAMQVPYVDTNDRSVEVQNRPAKIEWMFFPRPVKVPNAFTIRIPVYVEDKGVPAATGGYAGHPVQSRLVGWAVFKVTQPLRVFSTQMLRPDYKEPGGVAATGTAKD